VFIQHEYTNQVKQNRSTAGSVGKGIANMTTEETKQQISNAEAQAMVIAEVANVLQVQNQEQMKTMMNMFEKILTSMHPAAIAPAPTASSRRPRNSYQSSYQSCPHCKKMHRKPEKCWELDVNKASRPDNWKSTKTT
jgi:hypothetical protein